MCFYKAKGVFYRASCSIWHLKVELLDNLDVIRREYGRELLLYFDSVYRGNLVQRMCFPTWRYGEMSGLFLCATIS